MSRRQRPSIGISSSSSSSSSDSYSSSMIPHAPSPRRRRTLNEVWNDIRLGGNTYQFHCCRSDPSTAASPPLRGIILQDFLSGPLSSHHVPSVGMSLQPLPLPPPPPPPTTALCLNTRMEFQYMNGLPTDTNSGGCRRDNNNDPPRHPVLFPHPSEARSSSPAGIFSFRANRQPLGDEEEETAGAGGRHKRMMKNRESAARSRARKQVYMNELEKEVKHLANENAMLTNKYEELRMAMAAAQIHAKKTLQRTSTAPF